MMKKLSSSLGLTRQNGDTTTESNCLNISNLFYIRTFQIYTRACIFASFYCLKHLKHNNDGFYWLQLIKSFVRFSSMRCISCFKTYIWMVQQFYNSFEHKHAIYRILYKLLCQAICVELTFMSNSVWFKFEFVVSNNLNNKFLKISLWESYGASSSDCRWIFYYISTWCSMAMVMHLYSLEPFWLLFNE